MAFSMIPAFPSTDLDRTAAFWGRLGFVDTIRYDDYGFLIVRHPRGLELHFGLDDELRPSDNKACAYVRCSTAGEARALYEEWAAAMPEDGSIDAPATTFYGMVEWPLLDPDRNLLRVGGPAHGS